MVPWTIQSQSCSSLGEFTQALCVRFGEGSPEGILEDFSKITQTGSVEEYQERFESLKALAMPSLPLYHPPWRLLAYKKKMSKP